MVMKYSLTPQDTMRPGQQQRVVSSETLGSAWLLSSSARPCGNLEEGSQNERLKPEGKEKKNKCAYGSTASP